MVILLYFENNKKLVKTYIIINSGTIGFAFIDREFAINHSFSYMLLKCKYEIEIFDERIT